MFEGFGVIMTLRVAEGKGVRDYTSLNRPY